MYLQTENTNVIRFNLQYVLGTDLHKYLLTPMVERLNQVPNTGCGAVNYIFTKNIKKHLEENNDIAETTTVSQSLLTFIQSSCDLIKDLIKCFYEFERRNSFMRIIIKYVYIDRYHLYIACMFIISYVIQDHISITVVSFNRI